jgi:hypothetical protein
VPPGESLGVNLCNCPAWRKDTADVFLLLSASISGDSRTRMKWRKFFFLNGRMMRFSIGKIASAGSGRLWCRAQLPPSANYMLETFEIALCMYVGSKNNEKIKNWLKEKPIKSFNLHFLDESKNIRAEKVELRLLWLGTICLACLFLLSKTLLVKIFITRNQLFAQTSLHRRRNLKRNSQTFFSSLQNLYYEVKCCVKRSVRGNKSSCCHTFASKSSGDWAWDADTGVIATGARGQNSLNWAKNSRRLSHKLIEGDRLAQMRVALLWFLPAAARNTLQQQYKCNAHTHAAHSAATFTNNSYV